jgi:hypothetical protein
LFYYTNKNEFCQIDALPHQQFHLTRKIVAGFAEKSTGLQNQNRFAVLVRARD